MQPTIYSKTRESATVVRVKPNSYQPSKAEMEEQIRLPAGTTPRRLALAVVTPIRIIKEPE